MRCAVLLASLVFAAVWQVAPALAASPGTVPATPAVAGEARPLVTVRLFLDLECPYSRQAWPVYRDAVKGFPAAELLVHHLPLSRHRHAVPAAMAAVAARQQGKEAEFIDALLRDPVPDSDALARAARVAGLDGDALARFVQAPQAAAQVERERQAGLAFGIQATPSALVGGRGIAGSPPPEALLRALQGAAQSARTLQAEAGPNADVERLGLLRGTPEFAGAFDALRGGRVAGRAPVAATAPSTGRLGDRWRVAIGSSDLAAGKSEARVTAVLLLDPTSAWHMGQLRELLALQARHDVRTVVKLLPRADARGRLERGQSAGLDVALLLTAAAQGWPEVAPKLLAALSQRPPMTGADVEALAAAQGMDPVALRKAAEAPAATVAVQQGIALAERVDAWPGAIFLNGRRWLGHALDTGLAPAIDSLRAEFQSQAARMRGQPAAKVYAALVDQGRWRSDADLDLHAPETLGDLASLPELGSVGVPVHLFVDFASPHSRAAFFMVRRLVTSTEMPIRLRMSSIASSSEPCVTPSGAAFVVAHRMGKGMAMAELLFEARSPNQWQAIFGFVKKLRLKLGDFQKTVDHESTREVARTTARVKSRLDMADEPVLYIGDRLYVGPLDEARIERAIRLLQHSLPSVPAAPRSLSD